MTTNTLVIRKEDGWRTGFGTLLRKENHAWWGTRQWWVQLLIWTAILNGILFALIKMLPETAPPEMAEFRPEEGVAAFISFIGLFAPIGAIIAAQGAILDEKRSGTLESLLARPVSRVAVILSKLMAYSFGLFVTIIAVQGVLAYGQIRLFEAGEWSVLNYAAAILISGLSVIFYLTLTLMLGTLFEGRGAVIGIPMALLLGYQAVLGIFPEISFYTHYGLSAAAAGPESGPLAEMVLHGESLTSITPLIGTLVMIVAFVAVAIWRFSREEF